MRMRIKYAEKFFFIMWLLQSCRHGKVFVGLPLRTKFQATQIEI